eukprot:TRINITY_DN1257_c0_g1_i6.p1 TRINITY_DN1257_c0_g1~~TRINITY_DN1257_c0_g1_i6.p1  ORF type:complete len:113 (-),score=42.01 TRINITY_DN1257_c0_g1_i6:31-369(-)
MSEGNQSSNTMADIVEPSAASQSRGNKKGGKATAGGRRQGGRRKTRRGVEDFLDDDEEENEEEVVESDNEEAMEIEEDSRTRGKPRAPSPPTQRPRRLRKQRVEMQIEDDDN